MWIWLTEVHVSNHPSGLLKSDLFYGLMKKSSDLPICWRLLICTDQEKGAVVITQQGFSDGEIVFDMGNDIFGNGNEPILAELGPLDI